MPAASVPQKAASAVPAINLVMARKESIMGAFIIMPLRKENTKAHLILDLYFPDVPKILRMSAIIAFSLLFLP